MNHNRIEKQLSAYLDDELNPEKRAKVEAHLDTCDGCATMLLDFQQNRRRIGAWEHQAPRISDLVLSQLSDLGPVQRRLWPNAENFRRRFFRPVMGGAFALISACLLLALVYFNQTADAENSLDVYLAMHTQNSVYYSLQSTGDNDLSDENTTTFSTSPNDDTDFFLEVYLGD